MEAAELLGLPHGASAREVRAAFAAAVRAAHPDGGGDPEIAASTLSRLVAAREELLGGPGGPDPRTARPEIMVRAYQRRRRLERLWRAFRPRRSPRALQ